MVWIPVWGTDAAAGADNRSSCNGREIVSQEKPNETRNTPSNATNDDCGMNLTSRLSPW